MDVKRIAEAVRALSDATIADMLCAATDATISAVAGMLLPGPVELLLARVDGLAGDPPSHLRLPLCCDCKRVVATEPDGRDAECHRLFHARVEVHDLESIPLPAELPAPLPASPEVVSALPLPPEPEPMTTTEVLRKLNDRVFEQREADRLATGFYARATETPAEEPQAEEAEDEEEAEPVSDGDPATPARLWTDDTMLHRRPVTRGDCVDGPRPCPYVSCHHHLYWEVAGKDIANGRPAVSVSSLEESCALDVADRGSMTLEEVGTLFGICRERVRQIEKIALQKAQRNDKYRGNGLAEHAEDHRPHLRRRLPLG